MEPELLYLNCLAGSLSVKYFFVVASELVKANHLLWFAYHFKQVDIERGLNDAVIELDYECELLVISKFVSQKLHILDFVASEAPVEAAGVLWSG